MSQSKCRITKEKDLISVCNLGTHSLCGYFPESPEENLETGSLELGWSPSSGLLQLTEDRDITSMYGDNYGYRSGLNLSMVKHLKDKVGYLSSLIELNEEKCVLDIGSNDGTLLSFYSKNNLRVGIDPTIKKFKDFYSSDILKIPEFFSSEIFLKASSGRKADIITSISMFYDLPNPSDFVQNIAESLSDQGIWNLEQSYMPSMLKTNSYDTICHEHIEYYSLKVIKDLLDSAGLRIIDVTFNKINGGSFSVVAAHEKSKLKSNNAIINWILSQEKKQALHTPFPYRDFERRAYEHRSDLKNLINLLSQDGNKIAGYGASTKGNVILQFCKFTSKEIYGIAEVNGDKYGKYTPSTNIPIHSEKEIKSEKPDYMLVLPWHFRSNIIEREKEYLKNGGKLIFPLPDIEIVA